MLFGCVGGSLFGVAFGFGGAGRMDWVARCWVVFDVIAVDLS